MSSPVVRRARWDLLRRLLGDDHPRTRAAFGRYAAAKGWAITETSAGEHAYRAWGRAAHRPGFQNRRQRRFLAGDFYYPLGSPRV